MFFVFRTHLIHWPFAFNAKSCKHNNCCYVTKYHSCNLGDNYIHAVSPTVGYCLYRTLLLRPRWTACPVQIRAHHHIDVYTDINQTVSSSDAEKQKRLCEKTMFFAFRTHLIHRPFASNATSCMTQQLLPLYQISQKDRHHFSVTGIL